MLNCNETREKTVHNFGIKNLASNSLVMIRPVRVSNHHHHRHQKCVFRPLAIPFEHKFVHCVPSSYICCMLQLLCLCQPQPNFFSVFMFSLDIHSTALLLLRLPLLFCQESDSLDKQGICFHGKGPSHFRRCKTG